MTTWTEITQPAVGGKITAGGFGLQVYTSVNELQDGVDAVTVREHAAAGRDVPSSVVTASTVTTGAGITTVVAAPSAGTTRLVKALFIDAPTAATTVTLTLASTVIGFIPFQSAGIAEIDTAIPLTSTDTNGLRVTAVGGTVYVTCVYVDRTDTLVTRLGLASGRTSGTLVASLGGSGATRYMTELWVGNQSSSTAGAATVAVGGSDLLHSFTVPAGGIVILDMTVPITNSTAVTWAGDTANNLAYLAIGH